MDDDEAEGDDDLDEMQVTKKTVNNGGLEETGSEIGAAPLPFDQVRISCPILRNNKLFRFQSKFRRIGVPTRDSFSSRVLKVCNPSRVEARY